MLKARAAALAVMILLALPALAVAQPSADRSSATAKARGEALVEQAVQSVDTDPAKARRLSEQAVEVSDDPEILSNLASHYAMGIGGPVDEAKARALWEQAVARGSIAARLNLGRALLYERSDADRRRGVKLLSEAAKDPRMEAPALSGLGVAYTLGVGVERDLERGVGMLEKAEAGGAGDGHVTYLLGRAYQNGWGGRAKDPVRSFRYFKAACDREWSRACWFAAMALREGDGAAKDVPSAYRLVRQGAEAGDERCMISTAVMLATAEGVAENDVEARAWYRKAADEHNSAHALRGLGMMLLNGEGGPTDGATGYAYLALAAEAGDAEAVGLRDAYGKALEAKGVALPAEVRAEVDRIRKDWIARRGMPQADQ